MTLHSWIDGCMVLFITYSLYREVPHAVLDAEARA